MMPMLAPIMHRVNVYMHFFYVPNRLVWNDWEEFITKGASGTLAPNLPKFTGLVDDYNARVQPSSLADYLGLPTGITETGHSGTLSVSQLPFRAYQLIYNEYFRDQNLSNPVNIPLDSLNIDFADAAPLMQLQNARGKRIILLHAFLMLSAVILLVFFFWWPRCYRES